jgi:hypothetical protein
MIEVPGRLAGAPGLMRTDQLRLVLPDSSRRRLAAHGWLVPVSGKVWRAAGTDPTFRLRCGAALLDAGDVASLSHATSTYLMGVDGVEEPRDVDVTVPASVRRRRERVRMHAAMLDPVDRVMVNGLRCTNGARTIIDLAGVPSVTDRQLSTAVDCILRDRWSTEAHLVRRMMAPGHRRKRGAVRLRRVVLGQPRAHSMLERAFLDICVDFGLPMPTTQEPVMTDDGRLRRVDCWFEPWGRVVEVNGHRNHSTRADLARDAARHRAIERSGRRWTVFTSDEVFGTPEVVARDLAAALGVECAIGAAQVHVARTRLA